MRVTVNRATGLATLGVLLLATAGCAGSPGAGESASPTPSAPVLKVGDCRHVNEAAQMIIVSCDEEHIDEMFFEVAPVGDARDTASIEQHAEEVCTGDAFTDFIGVPRPESEFVVSLVTPEVEGFAPADGVIFCGVGPEGGVVTGTLEGAAR